MNGPSQSSIFSPQHIDFAVLCCSCFCCLASWVPVESLVPWQMLRQPTRRGDYPGRDRCGPSDPGLLGLPGLGMAQNSGIIPQMWAFLNIAGQTLDGYLVCFRALLTSKNLAFFFIAGQDWPWLGICSVPRLSFAACDMAGAVKREKIWLKAAIESCVDMSYDKKPNCCLIILVGQNPSGL